jgi:hypothetical protein
LLFHGLDHLDILPAPNDVRYNAEDPTGYIRIFWEPPTLVSDEPGSQNVSVDSRITHYNIIYITTEESTTVEVYNALGTSFTIGFDKIPCSFWFQVAAVNPAGVGEYSPPQNLTFDCELHHNNYYGIAKFLHLIIKIVIIVIL